MKKKIISGFFSFLYIICFIFPMNSYADETKPDTGGFSFEVIQPENQHNKEVTYFDLLMKPGQKQTVQMKMNNSSDEEIKISVKLNSAKTNSNGVIEYGPSQIKKDASLKYEFTDIVKAPEEVKIPAKGHILVDFNITMPESTFEGYISGGIQLQQIDGEVKKQTDTGMVVNKFAYLVGMLLSESDTKEIQPDLKLNKVYPELQNFRNAIFVNFSNVQPVYTEKMTVDAQITKKGSSEVLYETKKSNMRMAPNSMIEFPISMNGEKMTPGDYQAKVLVTTVAGGKWAWDQSFKITNEEADKFNDQDLSLVQDRGINWVLILLIVGGILLVIIVVFVIIRLVSKKKQKKKQLKRKATKKKKTKK
ncbi:DUF916 and DUF3324 domain-containing protein [Candidatus Enterococcus mansonii]|uniref:Uncharacterized protein n=1 Tax=Candidatus Enterococcus mansonii TaxID=1834181 RepID=A0A242CFC8_9ENTE|nr:DUF916 and DUF3324 domain-containing protein [Enterococcus sp. 4G2_DIV0659]OTO08943.1 hypothetical protein A5880_001943 [Enterococcus sp. 4G2_DIV0659]